MKNDADSTNSFQLDPDIYDQLDFSNDHNILLEAISNWIPEEDLDLETYDIGLFGGRTGKLATKAALRWVDCQIMSCDESIEYLEQARYEIEVEGVSEQVQLHHLPEHEFGVAEDQFDCCVSFHYLTAKKDLKTLITNLLGTLKQNGSFVALDFCRPDSADDFHYSGHSDFQPLLNGLNSDQTVAEDVVQQWLVKMIGNSPTLSEVRQIAKELGADPENIRPLNGLQWIWAEDLVSGL